MESSASISFVYAETETIDWNTPEYAQNYFDTQMEESGDYYYIADAVVRTKDYLDSEDVREGLSPVIEELDPTAEHAYFMVKMFR